MDERFFAARQFLRRGVGSSPLHTFMKQTILAIVLLSLFTTALLADFSEPFTDSPAGKTVTGKGWVIADSDGKSGFVVVVFTDTGPRVLSATVSTNLNVQPLLGRKASITATIQKDRSLVISDITLPGQATKKSK
jgi:hypothetical protein